VSSPKQLSVVLYDKLGLGGDIKKGSGANKSTDEETLTDFSISSSSSASFFP
jgi:DNA polymerase I-like protein with 3'-5' exonuclease and polymerase domains